MCRGERIGNSFISGELIRIEVGISNLFTERGGGMFMEAISCVIFFFISEFLPFALSYALSYMTISSELTFVHLSITAVLMTT